jgi:hypothetical protein
VLMLVPSDALGMQSEPRITSVLSARHAAIGINTCACQRCDERGTVSNQVYAELDLDWHPFCKVALMC